MRKHSPSWLDLLVVVSALAVVAVLGALLWPGGTEPEPVAAATPTAMRTTPTAAAPSTPPPAVETPAASTTPGIADLADAGWVADLSRATGIPERAMAAYAGAALQMAREEPACGLGWNTLAGIGWVETHHGTYDGATVAADGQVSPPIIGIPLDGNGTIPVRDTDGGSLDGDEVWDRAVGPMQFIPSTWDIYGRDGNGDGRIDINHIDDAALAAATYLCDVGGDLSVGSNWIRAVAAYNPSVDYNHKVAAAADTYAGSN